MSAETGSFELQGIAIVVVRRSPLSGWEIAAVGVVGSTSGDLETTV